MRGVSLFMLGVIAGGFAVHTAVAQNQPLSPNRGVIALNHVAISVPDVDKAVEYYSKVMGFPEAFRVKNAKGEIQLAYVQISKDTFIELLPAGVNRPPGLNHLGLHVDNMQAVTAMFKNRGANVAPINNSPTKAVLSNIVDLNGNRIELAELPPESLHAQATERWH